MLALLIPLALTLAPADEAGWKQPPQAIVDLIDARPTPGVRLAPDGAKMLLLDRPALPSLAQVSREWHGLAGLRIDARTGGPKTDILYDAIEIRDLASGTTQRLAATPGAGIGGVNWSHRGDRFMFTEIFDDRIDLVIADAAGGKRRTLATHLAPLLVAPRFLSDGVSILFAHAPQDRGAKPVTDALPTGPSIQESGGEKSPIRTWQDLLRTPDDVALFDWFATVQLAIVDSDGGERTAFGAPGVYGNVDVSPDGSRVLVERLVKPYSFVLPIYGFAHRIEVWDRNGALATVVAEIAAAENVPMEGVVQGPRDHRWHPTMDATLLCLEALDGGDPKNEAEFRDRLLAIDPPFDSPPRELLRLEQRARGLAFFAEPSRIAATDYDRDRRWIRTRLFDVGARPAIVLATLDDRNSSDRYRDPGALVQDTDERGRSFVRQDGDYVYRRGAGAAKDGARPFLDRMALATGATERLFHCGEGVYEEVIEVLPARGDGGRPDIVISAEAQEVPPEFFRVDLDSGDRTQLTSFGDDAPRLRGIRKELIHYQREDGVELSATLYLPAGYDETRDGKLPVFVWAYPLEYTDSATAGQVSGSPHRFTRVGGISHLMLLTQGYCVLDNATMPIVGHPETMNDTFVEQIVGAAKAALDELERRGVGDRERAAVGGHSYGAFMTANLLAHCDLFVTGIARSGAYNRTLTPFGFQSERRTLWEAKDVYAKVSPFFFADRIDEPLLLIHGANDANPGTFPMQSERLFQAIKGQGGKARLVMLPNEDHGYRARESALHCMAEMVEWLDRYLKAERVAGD
jgi:dipeptidyl aminopeptidase/acylaminoacyl peptidase